MKRIMKQIMLGLGMLLVLAPMTPSGASGQGGIRGTVYLYISYGVPIEVAPGLWIGSPSVQFPVASAFTILSAKNGREEGRVVTEASGAFTVALHPGKYVLVPEILKIPLGCEVPAEPMEVAVGARDFTLANIFYFQDGPCSIFGTLTPGEE